MAQVTQVNNMRSMNGMTNKESKALAALQLFLQDYKVTDIDVEPQVRGVTITASRKDGKPAYTAWGTDITEAVTNMVRSVLN